MHIAQMPFKFFICHFNRLPVIFFFGILFHKPFSLIETIFCTL
jgi:hypothetical protein